MRIYVIDRVFWEKFAGFPSNDSKTQSSLNFLQFGPRKITKFNFSCQLAQGELSTETAFAEGVAMADSQT